MTICAFHTLKTNRIILIPSIGLLLLTIGRDIHFSLTNQSSFYLSESLLFNTFWLLFLPIAVFGNSLLQKLPFQNYLLHTVILTSVHVLVFSIVVFSVSALFMHHTFGFLWVITVSLIDHWFTCILVYGLVQFLDIKKKSEKKPQNHLQKIKVHHGNQSILLPLSDIQYIKTERPYISLVTQQINYLHNETLAGFLKNHPAENFVQIHKSTLINVDAIHSYRSRKNGDYDIAMNNGDTVRASRHYKESFRFIISPPDSR